MPTPAIPIDLVGCQVVEVSFPAAKFRLKLNGKTESGQDVSGMILTLQGVANHFPLRSFMCEKRKLEKAKWGSNNLSIKYDLKLPAKITTCQISSARTGKYGDRAYEHCHGKFPELQADQFICLLALNEKRWKDRAAYPIIFQSLTLTDAKGKPFQAAATTEPTAKTTRPKRVKERDCRALGLSFLQMIIDDNVEAAMELLSPRCRKAITKTKLRTYFREFIKLFKEAKTAGYFFDLGINTEMDPDIIWELAQDTPVDFPRSQVVCHLEFCSEVIRESRYAFVVNQNDSLAIEVSI